MCKGCPLTLIAQVYALKNGFLFRNLLTRQAAPAYIPGTPRGSNSVVECNLAKVEVAGSNPVSRSKFPGIIA